MILESELTGYVQTTHRAEREPALPCDNVAHTRGPASDLWIYLLLAVAVLAVYGQVLHFDFVTYDDPDYVTANPHVQAGLTWAGVAWAFRSSFAGNWFPLTWLSHMLDSHAFRPGQRLASLHERLVYTPSARCCGSRVLKRLTGARWRSALVAFLFALHPLHVESVAWVAERKDVLSGLFWVLTLWSYAAYTFRPGPVRYALTLFALLPRPDGQADARDLAVGAPAAGSLAPAPRHEDPREGPVLRRVHRGIGGDGSGAQGGRRHRLSFADSGCRALRKLAGLLRRVFLQTLWPVDLAVFYPYALGSLLVPAVIAGIALAAVTVLAIRDFPRRPYLAIGWLWYLITLLPVIGLIQVGAQARADRYTYIPMVGLAIAMVWGVSEALERWPRIRMALAAAVCLACLTLTWLQVQYWRDSISLYDHAIDATSGNYVARFNLASVLEKRGDLAGATAQMRETVRLRPRLCARAR